MEKQVIKYYRKNVYGTVKEYVLDETKARLITALTGQKTIDARIRGLIGELTGFNVLFSETLMPEAADTVSTRKQYF